MREITAKQGQEIIDIARGTWKIRLAAQWGRNIVLGRTIEIQDLFYKEMREACTTSQHNLFDEIFGKDVVYKIGDIVKIIDNGNYSNNKVGDIGVIDSVWERNCRVNVPNNSTHSNSTLYRDIQLATKDEIREYKRKLIAYDRLKVGSVVRLKRSDQLYTTGSDVVNFDLPFKILIKHNNSIYTNKKELIGTFEPYNTFVQNNLIVHFATLDINYIEEVLLY